MDKFRFGFAAIFMLNTLFRTVVRREKDSELAYYPNASEAEMSSVQDFVFQWALAYHACSEFGHVFELKKNRFPNVNELTSPSESDPSADDNGELRQVLTRIRSRMLGETTQATTTTT